MYGQWRKPNVRPTAFGQALVQSELYDPKTSAVVRTFAEEATVGIGTLKADLTARDVTQADKTGVKLTEDEYKADPDLFSEGVNWYDGMTREGAAVAREFNEAAKKRSAIMRDASTGQTALGFAAGFGAGIVEPKNVAIGVGTAVALGPLAEVGVLGNAMRRIYQTRKLAMRSRVAIGAAEGVAGGIAIEPSNRYSAKILQQDYTMADSLFNVATSAAFGAALPALPGVRKIAPFMQEKIAKFKGRTMDVVAAEVDLATSQFAAGQRVDVGAVEAALPAAPIKKLREPDTFDVPSPPTREAMVDKSRVEDVPIAKVMSSQTKREWEKFNKGESPGELIEGYGDKPVVARFSNGEYLLFDGNHRTEMALNRGDATIQAHVIDVKDYAPGRDKKPAADNGMTDDELLRALTEDGPEQVRAQESQRQATLAKSQADTLNPENDTLIDYAALDAAEERKAIMGVENDAEAEIYFQEAEAEIRMMLSQEILNDADLAEYQSALDELNSAPVVDALETLKLCFTRG